MQSASSHILYTKNLSLLWNSSNLYSNILYVGYILKAPSAILTLHIDFLDRDSRMERGKDKQNKSLRLHLNSTTLEVIILLYIAILWSYEIFLINAVKIYVMKYVPRRFMIASYEYKALILEISGINTNKSYYDTIVYDY